VSRIIPHASESSEIVNITPDTISVVNRRTRPVLKYSNTMGMEIVDAMINPKTENRPKNSNGLRVLI
jgi:hypothetical protein